MKQEYKELLFKDLSARLPYGVIVTDNRHGNSGITEIDTVEETVYCDDFDEYVELDKCKPYLRQMSSMTEEERKDFYDNLRPKYDGKPWESMGADADWLNTHHFDYRGLIPKGLALEAPEGMYGHKQD